MTPPRPCFALALAVFFTIGFGAEPKLGNAAFEGTVNDIAAELVRADPALATSSQYFSGAEQDALDRKLIARDRWGPLGAGARLLRLEAARRGLDQLKRFSPAE